MNQEESLQSFLDLLAFMSAGRATIKVEGRRFFAISSDERTLEVENDGAKEAGPHLSDLVELPHLKLR